jgi:hypothetical protein
MILLVKKLMSAALRMMRLEIKIITPSRSIRFILSEKYILKSFNSNLSIISKIKMLMKTVFRISED